MGKTPEELRHEIEDTRRHLSETVDRIADRVSPGRVAHRRAEHTKRRLGGVRSSMTGSAQSTAHRVRGAVHMPHHEPDLPVIDDTGPGPVAAIDTTGTMQPVTEPGSAGRHLRGRAPLAAGVLAVCTGAAAGAVMLRGRHHHPHTVTGRALGAGAVLGARTVGAARALRGDTLGARTTGAARALRRGTLGARTTGAARALRGGSTLGARTAVAARALRGDTLGARTVDAARRWRH